VGTKTESLRDAAMRGAVWTLLERWLVRGTGLVVLVILGRLLVPAEFGLVAAASVMVDFVAIFVGTGMSVYLVQKEEIDDADTGTAFWVALVMAVVMTGALMLLAPVLAPLFHAEGLEDMVRVLAFGMLFAGVAGVPTALLQRKLAFRQLAMRSITATVVSSVVAVVLAFLGAGAWALVAQTVVFAAVRTVSVFLGARWWPSLRFSPVLAREMASYTAKLIGQSTLLFLRGRGQVFMIALVAGPTALGIWVLAGRVVTVVVELVNGVVAKVATPIFARAKSDPDRLARGYLMAVTHVVSALAPALCILAAVSQEAIPLLFSEQWRSAGPIAALIALGMVFLSATYLDGGLLLALNRAGLGLVLTAIAAASQLIIVSAALLLGASLTQLAALIAVRNLLLWPLRLSTINRVAPIDVRALLDNLVRVWLCSAFSGALAWLTLTVTIDPWPAWLSVGLAVLVGSVAYPLALWVGHRTLLNDLLRTLRTLVHRRRRPAASPARV
jgi:O-antigen/teichoic acid export membrane protein